MKYQKIRWQKNFIWEKTSVYNNIKGGIHVRILDKYILKEFLGPFLFGVAAFTAIFLGSDTLLSIAGYITKYGASSLSAIKIFILAIPRIVVYTFPMAVLLGALMCMASLSGASELIVMRNSGQSFIRLAMPIFIFASIISLCAIAFNEFVVPWTNREYQYILDVEIKKNLNPDVVDNIVMKDVQDGSLIHLIYAKKYNPNTRILEDITVQEFNDGKPVRIETAPKAVWNKGIWELKNGVIYDVTQGGVEHKVSFDKQAVPFVQKPDEIKNSNKNVGEMTIRELNEAAKILSAANQDPTSFYMEIHKRFSLPLASLVFAVVGAPLGIRKQRSSSSIGFGISVIVIFIYYAVMTFLEAMGEGHILPPIAAVWLPNILTFIIGCYLVKRVNV